MALALGERFHVILWSRYLAQDPLTYLVPPWLLNHLFHHRLDCQTRLIS